MTTACIVLVAAILILPDLLAADTEFRPYNTGSNRYVAAQPNPSWGPLNRQANVRFHQPPAVVRPRPSYRSGAPPPPPDSHNERSLQKQQQLRRPQLRQPVRPQNRASLQPPPVAMRSRAQGHPQPLRNLPAPSRQNSFRSFQGGNARSPPNKNFG